ncbi:sosondowah ankyrin repeat domain family Cb [Myxocyprinus asiaticus]|uniref:sosondowah ankyrin repeat domain family Cb n=1 Tax=Myxocyprinus asiaticus TaxID=70543 RepID=UPI00222306B3|nr:sosondowah ankyrin repeat domain family Cb [Myxocyprinus asiaticus]
MVTECNQEAVLYFIKERRDRVKNVDLTDHFRATIPKDPFLKTAAKETFKRFVDTVAFVKVENGEKYIFLRKKFRGSLPVSGYGTDSAGRVKSQPDIYVNFSEGVNSTKSDVCRTIMGNSNSSRTEDKAGGKAEQNVSTPNQAVDKDKRPEISVRKGSDETVFNSAYNGGPKGESEDENTKETRRHNEHQTDTSNIRREDFSEVPKNSSPQVRRSEVLRNSVYLSARCKDGPRADSDYEAAAVTLEPLEHEWMMCASDGQWESLHRLLLRDHSLLTRKDFVTGFTCLHWAAKLGKHELIVLLVNFAKERHVTLNMNARSSVGYTPLHLAAMHNHIEVVKLLVGAFDADVEVRDYNGKKACQYLKSDIAQNILDIVGACVETDAENGGVEDTNRWRLSRVIQSSFRPLKSQKHNSEEDSCNTKQKSLYRKSSFTKMKPSLHKIYFRSQIVHNTSFRFEKEATEEPPNPLRPQSNLFG